MKLLRFDWSRVVGWEQGEEQGTFNRVTVYVCNLRSNLHINVFRVGSYWRFIVIGYANNLPTTPMILKYGDGPTKNECQYRAEQVVLTAGVVQETQQMEITPIVEIVNDLPF